MATYTEIHIRRDSTLNWYASNPRLGLGEPGVDMDLHRFKIGNGIDRWNQLPYMDDDLYKLLDKQSQEIADRVQDLLNKIAANKLDADTKHNAVTTELRNTSRELQGRMTAVEDEQTEYESSLTARQKEYEESLKNEQTEYESSLTARQKEYEESLKNEQAEYESSLTARQEEYEESLSGDFEETKAEVHAGLEEFVETRDKLNIRMDVIAGQATEDTEILDARVDAEYQVHPNLGANIRSIHEQLISAEQTIAGLKSIDKSHEERLSELKNEAEKLSEHGEFLQGEIDTNAEAVLRTHIYLSEEALRARENDAEHSAEIARLSRELEDETATLKHEEGSRHTQEENFAEQIDGLSDAVLRGQFYMRGLTERIKTEEQARLEGTASARESALLRYEHAQEQIDELATALMSETKVREESDELQDRKLEGTIRRSFERDDYQQEQIDELADVALRALQRDRESREENAAHLRQESSGRITK